MASRAAALPPDVLALVLAFLSGFEQLPLSRVNRRFYYDLLAPTSAAWASRLPSRAFAEVSSAPSIAVRPRAKSSRHWKHKCKQLVGDLVRSRSMGNVTGGDQRTWKRLYFASTSFQLPGCVPGQVVERRHGGAIQLWGGLHHAWNGDSFSFDVWFALLPETKTAFGGGVLFAAQGTEWPGVKYGDDAQQFLHVDRSGNLFCSMMTEKAIVATNMRTHRWYHVALTIERHPQDWWNATQCVYLDGELIQQSDGKVHSRWRYLNHAQLGSGIMEGSMLGSPAPEHRGWYGLNGVIDDFRFWTGAVSNDQVRQLFRGQEESVEAEGSACLWSLKREGNLSMYGTNIRRVQSTRPREQRYEQREPERESVHNVRQGSLRSLAR